MKNGSSLGTGLVRAWLLVWTVALASGAVAQRTGSATVERIALLGSENGLELQISSNIPVPTDSQLLVGPDRIVIDLNGALPGARVRGFTVNQAGIRAVRVGLFESNPPKTRVVIDLERPIQYQLMPSGRAVLVKFGSSPSLVAVSAGGTIRPTGVKVTPPQPPPPLQVSYANGLLQINARKATLAEVLYQIHLHTGADIPVPAGAEQEQIVINAGPGPAKEVLATVLNGSRFNFVLVGSAEDPNVLKSVILTPKMDGGFDQVVTAVPPAVAPTPQPEVDPGAPPVPEVSDPQPVPEAQTPDQAQPQPLQAPTAPPPPPMQEQNRPWTEAPPQEPQPE